MALEDKATSIIVGCECGKKFRAKEEHVGKRANCPACGRMLVIAVQSPAESGDGVVALSESDALRSSAAKPTESSKAHRPEPFKTGTPQATGAIQPAPAAPARKYSLAGLIIAGILIVSGIYNAFRQDSAFESSEVRRMQELGLVNQPPTPEARAARLFLVLGGIAGGLTLAVRSFLPCLSFWRGLLVYAGSISYVQFVPMLMLHGMGPPHLLLFRIVLPGLALAFGFRTTETRAERRRRAVWEESNRAVEKAQAQGHAAKLCQPCGGSGRRGWMLEWRCGICKGAGYLVSAAESSSDR